MAQQEQDYEIVCRVERAMISFTVSAKSPEAALKKFEKNPEEFFHATELISGYVDKDYAQLAENYEDSED